MKIESIDIDKTINEAKMMLKKEEGLSSSFKAVIQVLLLLVGILVNRLKLNSSNSSKPPSTDPNRKRKTKSAGDKKQGGQNGHKGYRLKKVKNPDVVKVLKVDKKLIPFGKYKEVGFECRQVVDIEIKKIVTEYRAQILKDSKGKKYVAPFPQGITSDIQYGNGVKAHCVYMSQFQLLPYNRIGDYFAEQMNIPISAGSIFNFNKEAYDRLNNFDEIAKNKLIQSPVVNVDETGINIDGKRRWLHSASSPLWTYFYPHEKRGSEAMDAIGIISNFSGILCHDHWKSYYNYNCLHALCNAHHLRELERAIEQDDQKWAIEMKDFLIASNQEMINYQNILSEAAVKIARKKYRDILKKAEIECPSPPKIEGKRGRTKKSKSRNLLERFINYEDDVLRFMENKDVPFTNNLGENDLRMTKVQQKISGCFRSLEGAYIFCRLRGYLSTCRKNGMTITKALKILFEGMLPDFVNDS
jgi:transposase